MKKILCVILLIFCFTTLTGCNLLKSSTDTSNNTPNENSTGTAPTSNPGDTGNNGSGSNGQNNNNGNNNGGNGDNNNNNGQNPNNGQNNSHTAKEYFPSLENTFYYYEGKGNEFAFFTMWMEYFKGNKLQQKINNGGTEYAKVIEYKNGELKIIFSRPECYYREDFTSKPSNANEVLLKEPLQKGTSWTLTDGRKRYISAVDVSVTTPIGYYKAIEVTTENKEGTNIDYYALNVGLVKSVFKSASAEVSSTLSKITKNTPSNPNVTFYYPNANDDKIHYYSIRQSFNTNDITKLSFEKYFKNPPKSDLMKLMGPNAKINSMYLNDDGMVYVDFNDEFVTEMNVGASYEGMILQAVTNTIGQYYGVKKVYITLQGQPYRSGHIAMNKGEAFVVDMNNCVQN